MITRDPDITRLLRAWGAGDQAALDKLTPLVYQELRRIARGHMRRENPGHNTLQTTALVNDVPNGSPGNYSAKAGVMFRDSLAANSVNAFIAITPGSMIHSLRHLIIRHLPDHHPGRLSLLRNLTELTS